MIKSSLQLVDFIDAHGKPMPGLIPIRHSSKTALQIDEKIAIRDAATFEHIDYIFFRRFSDGRSSQIAAYIIDNTDYRLDEKIGRTPSAGLALWDGPFVIHCMAQ